MGQNNRVVVDGLGDETEKVWGFKLLRICEAASDIAIILTHLQCRKEKAHSNSPVRTLQLIFETLRLISETLPCVGSKSFAMTRISQAQRC
jgi:hypothetical protein